MRIFFVSTFICALICGEVLGLTTSAGEKSLAQLSVNTESTSDKQELQTFQMTYRNHRRDPLWAYENEKDSAWDFGLRSSVNNGDSEIGNYQAGLLAMMIAKKFSPAFYVDVEAGVQHIKDDKNATKEMAIAGIGTFVELNAKWIALLHLKRDSAFDLFGPSPIFSRLHVLQVIPELIFKPTDRIQLVGKSTKSYFSDKNIRTHHEFSAMYGIANGTHWIWLGIGGEILKFSKSTSADAIENRYWSPLDFYSFGPRLDTNIPVSEHFSFALAANVSRMKEDQFETTTGLLIAPALIYGQRESKEIKLSYMRIESRQSTTKWTSDAFSLNGQLSF